MDSRHPTQFRSDDRPSKAEKPRQARQPIEPFVDRRRFRHDPPKGVRRHAEASRYADAFDPRKLPQVRALAATIATCVWSISWKPST